MPLSARTRDNAALERFKEGEELERSSRPEEALTAYRDAEQMALAANDSITLADARYRSGLVNWGKNRYDTALVQLGLAKAVREHIGGDIEYARILNGLGVTYYQLGLYEPAIDAFVPSARTRRLLFDSLGLARTLTNIGKVYHDWGQQPRARRVFDEAILVAERASKGAPALGYVLNSRALLAIDDGDFARADELIERSRRAYYLPGAALAQSDTLEGLELNAAAKGLLLLRQGRAREALPIFDTVRTSAIQRGSVRARALAQLRSGEAYVLLGQPNEARGLYVESLGLARQVAQRVLTLEALDRLVKLEQAQGATSAAFSYLLAFQALRDTIFDQDAALRIAAREAREETMAALAANRELVQTNEAQDQTIARQRSTLVLGSVIVLLAVALLVVFARLTRSERARAEALARSNAELATLNAELTTALADVKTLSGLIPICSHCKKVRDDRGYWEQVETFVAQRSNATFSHSICQSCGPELYGELWTADE